MQYNSAVIRKSLQADEQNSYENFSLISDLNSKMAPVIHLIQGVKLRKSQETNVSCSEMYDNNFD